LPFYVQNACSDHSSHLVEQDTGGEKSTPMELNTQQHTQQQQAAAMSRLLVVVQQKKKCKHQQEQINKHRGSNSNKSSSTKQKGSFCILAAPSYLVSTDKRQRSHTSPHLN
jgi:hypothetical protein